MTEQNTIELLQRWHGGDRDALADLLARDLPWIRERVTRRLGTALKGKAESDDLVQDAMIEVLRYAPRFEISSRELFRGLLAQIVENVLRGRANWFNAQRRELARERPLPGDTVVNLDPPRDRVGTPSVAAGGAEEEARLRLALELLEPEDREILVLRQWRDLSFAEIAKELGIAEDAARMRFNRTLPKLASKMSLLRDGNIESLLAAGDG